jgi:5-methylcytosine-specific restriction endonuclease McrA
MCFWNWIIPPAKVAPLVRKKPKKKRRHPGGGNPRGLRSGLRGRPKKALSVTAKPKQKKAKPPANPKSRREAMYLEMPWCHWCMDSVSYMNMTLDHVIPLSRGGTNARHNLVVACQECNNRKGSWMPDDWLSERMDADEVKWWKKIEDEQRCMVSDV